MSALKNGIESVKKNADVEIEDQTVQDFEELKCPKWEIYTDKAGEFRFRLKASNGEIILAASEGYTAKANAKKGIESGTTRTLRPKWSRSDPIKAVRDQSRTALSTILFLYL